MCVSVTQVSIGVFLIVQVSVCWIDSFQVAFCVQWRHEWESKTNEWWNRSLHRQWTEIEKTYRWLVCSWSLLSCVGCDPERRSRHMAWRAATSRANPCRATTLRAHLAVQQQVHDDTASAHRATTRGQDRINKWDHGTKFPGRLSQNWPRYPIKTIYNTTSKKLA